MGNWGGKGAAECWSLKIFEIKNQPHSCFSKPSITFKKIMVTLMNFLIFKNYFANPRQF